MKEGYYKIVEDDCTFWLKNDGVIDGKAICTLIVESDNGFSIDSEAYLLVDKVEKPISIKKSEFYNKLKELVSEL